jgi:Uncharacterized proteins of the AP superfamily
MNRLISSLIAILAISGINAQESVEIPKLIINITIDQLRGDYLQYFNPYFGERGFKRLLNEGLVYRHIEYDFPNLGEATSIATLHTGTNPCYHGIVADKKYSFEEQREVSIIRDEAYIGNYTAERFSPLALLGSTVGDELKIASEGRSDVYAIAPNAIQAVMSGGRSANAAFWVEDYNGKWASGTYYKDIPWYIDRYNNGSMTGYSSEELTWTPLRQYRTVPYTKKTTEFKHVFSKNDKSRYLKIKTSPFVNTEVTALAGKFFEFGELGKRSTSDMLLITYYAGNYKNETEEYSAEIQDIYCRLDKELENLLDLAEKHVGLKNTLVVLSSTGYFKSPNTVSETNKPYGEFYPKRCTALLNMYLMAIYGEGNWVLGYYNNQIYLNRKLIEDKKLDLAEIQKKSAEFAAQFSGIQDVTYYDQLFFEGNGNTNKGIHRKNSGDLFLELQPGWIEIDDQNPRESKEIRNNTIVAPLIFFGQSVPGKGKIDRPIKATTIAPTLTHVLRIRPPNASKELPIREFLDF